MESAEAMTKLFALQKICLSLLEEGHVLWKDKGGPPPWLGPGGVCIGDPSHFLLQKISTTSLEF